MPSVLSFSARAGVLALLALAIFALAPAVSPAAPPKNYLDNPAHRGPHWAGPPGNAVKVTATFTNTGGVPGA
jgi:hypothetical protein